MRLIIASSLTEAMKEGRDLERNLGDAKLEAMAQSRERRCVRLVVRVKRRVRPTQGEADYVVAAAYKNGVEVK